MDGMTEDEARARLCHRTLGPVDSAPTGRIGGCHCAASFCVAWKWLPGEQDRFYRQREDENRNPMQGDCGLKR